MMYIYRGTIGEHSYISTDDINLLVINFQCCRVYHATLLVGALSNLVLSFCTFILAVFIGSLCKSIHCSLGIDEVCYSVLLLWCKRLVIHYLPRVFFKLSNTHFCIISKHSFDFIVCFTITKYDSISIGIITLCVCNIKGFFTLIVCLLTLFYTVLVFCIRLHVCGLSVFSLLLLWK